ncbi:MAG: L,D-transpeptidase family protein [Nocardioidaceae bacterium]
MRRLGALIVATLLLASGPSPLSAQAKTPALPERLGLAASVTQLVTVTSSRWSNTRATLRAWQKSGSGWHVVRGPFTVRLGWNGWVRAHDRHQSTGTTPAGKFRLPYAFGNAPDPGTALTYKHVDSNDVWPYEPRDPATYNIYQPYRARTSHWRTGYREHLAGYPRQYAYAVVIGFNMPSGVHWSSTRHQYVARHHAAIHRGGGIFLHVERTRYTAGCVAGPRADIRWIVRWLDPAQHPRIAMGPQAWLVRRF